MLAVISRRRPHAPLERPAHHRGTTKSDGVSNVIEAALGCFQFSAARFKSQLLDKARRRNPELAREHARKVPGTHRYASCQTLNREVPPEIFRDPDGKLAKRLVLGGLRR